VGAATGAHQHVLQFLRDEGCVWDEKACAAAVHRGHLTILEWLHEHGCPWKPDEICYDAAKSGSVETLVYLKQQGCLFSARTMYGAAMEGRLAVCQYLVAEQCPRDESACSSAAVHGHLQVVRFLHESGCPWHPAGICESAAVIGSIALMQYLRQEGCILNEGALDTAAEIGDLRMCQYLRAERCPWDAGPCAMAAHGGHVDTLRWLHEQGCPWDSERVRSAAASSGALPVIRYALAAEPAASAAQLTEMLAAAGAHHQLSAAQWLRQQGAEWPVLLRHAWMTWSGDVLQWARDEGCTSCL
jgi:hypothetical protein